MIKKIDHIAIAIKNLDEEIKKYRGIAGFEFSGIEIIKEQKVRVAFFYVGDIKIELLEPTSNDSPIATFLKKRGSGIHHIAYEVDDIKSQIKEFEKKNITVLNAQPQKGAHNSMVSFTHPKSFSGVLVELVQIKE